MMRNIIKNDGFTLIELAIVLVIVGLLAGSFISTLSSRIETTRVSDTQDEMELIKQSLYGFAMATGTPRLPCPDCNTLLCATAGNLPNDGVADEDPPASGICNSANQRGNIPWVTLGLGRGDAWGNHYSYWVAPEYTVGVDMTTLSPNAANIDDTVAAGANTVASNIAAVVMSHGKDSYGAISVDGTARENLPADVEYNDQRENLDAEVPALFIDRPISQEGSANVFDDIIIWISEYELRAKMVEAGALP